MTDKYTIEEIEKAVRKALVDPQKTESLRDYIIRELTKPAYEFREGEAIISESTGHLTKVGNVPKPGVFDYRHLRLSEMPKAVEDLREAANMCECSHTVAHAIAAFDKEIEK